MQAVSTDRFLMFTDMKITSEAFELKLKHSFKISGFSRISTPIMLLKIGYEGQLGLGEASMVPYMGESFDSASTFLSKVDLSWLKFPFDYMEVTTYLDSIAPANPAIKAAIDIALNDLGGKLHGKPCYSLFDAVPLTMPVTSVTIGIDSPAIIIEKVKDAGFAKVLKVKLGSEDDKLLINTIRSVTNKPLYADANQGWTDRNKAVDMLYWLKEQGVEVVEQPMPKADLEGNAWVTERSPLPILADEACQRFPDLDKIKGAYHGVNIKLMKSAGMHEAFRMIQKARELKLKIMIGCMSETSIATLAAAALAPLCDWADLDGPFLTANNPYKTPAFKDGKWVLSQNAGLGMEQ